MSDQDEQYPPVLLGLQVDLTAKQAEALKTAHEQGFFERPQDATAEEIADTLDVTRSTFLHHVRNAEQELVDTLFEAR